MARPFDIARESSDLEGATANAEPLTVGDTIQEDVVNDEVSADNAVIEKDSSALEDLVEEASVVSDQIEENETKLENPETITSADVVTSEECLKRSMYSLGYKEGLGTGINLASEAAMIEVKNHPAKHLEISNEGVKEFLAKIISTIRAIIQKVIISAKKMFTKVMFKLGNYEKKLAALMDEMRDKGANGGVLLQQLKANLKGDKDDIKDFANKIIAANPLYAASNYPDLIKKNMSSLGKQYVNVMVAFQSMSKDYITAAMNDSKMEAKAAEKKSGFLSSNWQKIKNLFKGLPASASKEPKDLIQKYSNDKPAWMQDDHELIGVLSNTAYFLANTDKIIETTTIDVDWSAESNVITASVVAFANNMMDNLKETYNQVKNRKQVFEGFDKNQDEYLKYLKSLESTMGSKIKDASKSKGFTQAANVLKVGAAQLNLLMVKLWINDIKSTMAVASAINDFVDTDAATNVKETIQAAKDAAEQNS